MATNAMERVRNGMEVVSSDGTSLGKIKEVYHGTVPTTAFQQCDDETTLEVHRGSLLGKGTTLYVPCRAVGDVSGDQVRLNVDNETVSSKGWIRKPSWIGR